MSILRSRKLGLYRDNTATTDNPVELLPVFNNNLDDNNTNKNTLHWIDDVGECGKRIAN